MVDLVRYLGFELDFVKLGLGDLPPLSFGALRLAVAVAILLLILAVTKISFPRDRRFWILAGATGFLQFFLKYGLVFWGLQHISSGLAAVLQATIPAFGLALIPFYLPAEKITRRKVFAILLGITGVGAIFYEQLHISGVLAIAGSAAVLAGAFFFAYASVLTRARGTKSNSTALLTAQMIVGFVPLALLGWILEGNPINFRWTWTAIFCVLYLGLFGTVAGFGLFYWLLQNNEMTKAMMTALVTPLVAVIIGSFFGESLQWQALAGAALILLSVALILYQAKRKAVAAKTEEKDLLKTGAVDFGSDSDVTLNVTN